MNVLRVLWMNKYIDKENECSKECYEWINT